MLSLKKICKISVLLGVVLLIGFQRIFGFLHFMEHGWLYRGGIAALSIVSAVLVLLMTRNHPEIKAYFRTAAFYLILYVPIIMFSALFTKLSYDYSTKSLLYVVIPYLYIFFCFSIIYVFYKAGQTEDFSRTISRIVLVILFIKTLCWVLYTFFEIELFPNLLFEYEGWTRDGQIRLDTGYLFSFAFSFYISLSIKSKKKLVPLMALLFLFLFMAIISKGRFQLATMVFTAAIAFVFLARTSTKARNTVLLLGVAAMVFVCSGAFEKVLYSFSLSSQYGSSTEARLQTISHFWDLMIDRKAILGLGLLDTSNPAAFALLYKATTYWGATVLYYLTDIGILGGFFTFGLLSIPLYGTLFFFGIRTCIRAFRQRTEGYELLVPLIVYMITSCLLLNIFDLSRALDVPFYLAVISYMDAKTKIKE